MSHRKKKRRNEQWSMRTATCRSQKGQYQANKNKNTFTTKVMYLFVAVGNTCREDVKERINIQRDTGARNVAEGTHTHKNKKTKNER